MYIRWMGAFAKNGSLSESIHFEMARTSVVACEQLQSGKSFINNARVGLLVDPKAVYKRFSGDIWSEYSVDGQLFATRKYWEAKSQHRESFAKPVYTGIVIKNGSLNTLKYAARQEVISAHEQHSLPVYRLVKGKLIKEL